MFAKLRKLFRRPQRSSPLIKNRKRFTAIISDKRSNYLEDVFKRLEEEDPTLSDSEILDKYYKFSDAIQTNTFAAAELEWVAISQLCAYRPHLTDILIRRGLLSIVWSIGDAITSEDVLEFIRQRILMPNVDPYGGLPPDKGLKWLTETLPLEKKLIKNVLTEVIAQNNLELEKLDK
jgi:hypothetical protein